MASGESFEDDGVNQKHEKNQHFYIHYANYEAKNSRYTFTLTEVCSSQKTKWGCTV